MTLLCLKFGGEIWDITDLRQMFAHEFSLGIMSQIMECHKKPHQICDIRMSQGLCHNNVTFLAMETTANVPNNMSH